MSYPDPLPSAEFPVDQVWSAIGDLLSEGLGDTVSVDLVGEKDFDEQGYLTVTPPAVRVVFLEQSATAVENQGLTYDDDQMFAVICCDEDRSADPQAQRMKSVLLAGWVKHLLTGARVVIEQDTENRSYPVLWTATKPLPTTQLGMAYVVAFKVTGIASFSGPNATPGGSNA